MLLIRSPGEDPATGSGPAEWVDTGSPGSSFPDRGEKLLSIWEALGRYKVSSTGQINLSTWEKDYNKTVKRLAAVASDARDRASAAFGGNGEPRSHAGAR